VKTLRALPTLFRVGLAEAVAYRAELVVWLLTTTMPLVSLALWASVGADHAPRGWTEAHFVSYFLVTLVVRQVTGSWVVWELTFEIRSGALATKLLRPIPPVVDYAARNLSAVPLRWLACAPIVALFLRGEAVNLLLHPVDLAAFAVSLGLAWAINFSIMLAIGALAFFVQSAQSLYQAYMVLFMVLSGYLVPLSFLPPRWQVLADALPFAQTLAVPVSIGTGALSGAGALRAVAIQGGWALGGWALALVIWSRGVRKYAAFGG